MSKTFKNLACITLAGIATVSLASCGNTDNSNTLVIGLECNYAPFNWTTPTQSEYTLPIANQAGQYADGYDVQFAKYASEELGMNVKIVKLEWDNLIPQLQLGQINCIIAGMTDTEERRKTIDFTEEYYRSELTLVVKKSVADEYESSTPNPIGADRLTTLLSGKALESQIQTVTDDVIDNLASQFNAVHLTAVNTFAKAASDVASGVAFGMTAELPVAESIVKSNSNLGIIHISQDVLGLDLSELGVSIGIRKEDTDLKDKLNQVLAKFTNERRTEIMSSCVTRSGE